MTDKKAIVTSMAEARATLGKEPRVEIYTVGIEGFEKMIRDKIDAKLDGDKDALKAFQCVMYKPENEEQALALKQLGRPLADISGALGLNDSGIGWLAFRLQTEMNLSDREDREIADKIAHQCLKCVAKMKRDSWRKMAVNA